MKNLKNWMIWLIITPILSMILWIIFTNHTFVSYINTLLFVSYYILHLHFFILLVQEGIFDATSYGFRRIRYQLSSRSKREQWRMMNFKSLNKLKRNIILYLHGLLQILI